MYSEDYRRAAQDAIQVQNAPNLSAILFSIERARNALLTRRRDINEGTDWFNKHPVMYLYSIQIGYLTGALIAGDGPYHENFKICEKIAAGEEVEGM